MEERLLAFAGRFWPELETMSGPNRTAGVFDVVGFLYSAPLVLVGLVWLIAVTFTGAGGQVAVEAGVVKEGGEHWITIVVRDTGPGISREEQERVFDRFYRGKLAESGHVPGTGLGLSIAQEILRAHGGRVTVESKEGEGSAFTLWLRGVPSGEAE